MVQIAGKPFTQLTNLNILDELRVQGFLITGQQIVEVTNTYTVEIDDAIIIADGTFTVTLPFIANTVRNVTIIAKNGTITIAPTGSDTLPIGASPVTNPEAITLSPSKVTNEWLGT